MARHKVSAATAAELGDFGMPASEVTELEAGSALTGLEARVWVLEQMHTANPAPYRTLEGYKCSRCHQLITKDMTCAGDHPDECPHVPTSP